MSNRNRRLERRASKRVELRNLLVFVEGEKTEEQYVKSWAREYRGTVSVTVPKTHGTPLALVKAASDEAKRDRRISAKRGGPNYDEYWCVFDKDEHPRMGEAIQMAKDNDIRVALSVPCLELWFLIHFEDQTASIDRSVAQSRSSSHLSCEKSLTHKALEQLIARYPEAKTRAIALDAKHRGDGTRPFPNPSSGVWQLVESIAKGDDD